ncbi:MAG TPA: FHA domain-containing protein [Polyangiaceae bacterium]|nr:FHA domain-containing protein [Polyangiaceae bacterium]
MITCPKCSKENQDHYKFCLGCGAELPRDAAPKAFSPQTPPHGMRAAQAPAAAPAPAPAPAPVQPAPVAAPPVASVPRPQAVAAAPPVAAAPAPAAGSVLCPQCGHVNSTSNKFCASCGYNMTLVAAPAALGAPVAAPAAGPSPGQLVLTALRADGSEAGSFALPSVTTTVGRDIGGIFAGDSYLSPRHATFSVRGAKVFAKDEVSLNGVYIKLAPEQPVELQSGDVFRIGQEIIRFEVLSSPAPAPDGVERLGSPSKGYVGRISLLTGRDTTGNAYPVPEHGLHIGRERGDILFPEDGYVSGLHCRIGWEGRRAYLTDLGSSNGTFARLYAEREIHDNDVLLMGQQLFRVNF